MMICRWPFRVYDANAMRMKPILHLLGDRHRAAQYIRFAERKLAELKQMMSRLNLSMQNRLYRFTTDSIEIYIESFRGIDKIRIKAAKEEVACTLDALVTSAGQDEKIFLRLIAENSVGVRCEVDTVLWELGDGNWKFGNATLGGVTEYRYEFPGTYTVKAHPWLSNGSSYLISLDSLASQFRIGARDANINTAYSNFLAAPWNTVTAETRVSYIAQDFDIGARFEYQARRCQFNVDLTDTVTLANTKIVLRANAEKDLADIRVMLGSAFGTNLPSNNPIDAPEFNWIFGFFPCHDMTSLIGTVVNVETFDGNSYAQIDPGVTDVNGFNLEILEVRAYPYRILYDTIEAPPVVVVS